MGMSGSQRWLENGNLAQKYTQCIRYMFWFLFRLKNHWSDSMYSWLRSHLTDIWKLKLYYHRFLILLRSQDPFQFYDVESCFCELGLCPAEVSNMCPATLVNNVRCFLWWNLYDQDHIITSVSYPKCTSFGSFWV